MSGPVLVWVQHLLGSGHLRRALTLAGALRARGCEVTVATGGAPHSWPPPGGVDLVQLPPLRAADAHFSQLLDETGSTAGPALWAARRERLEALALRLRPALLVTEMFPFGRGAFRAEIMALRAACLAVRPGLRMVASVRDILVGGKPAAKQEAMAATARAFYDKILVHTDRHLAPFALTFAPAARLTDLIHETGYLTEAAAAEPAPGPRDEVLVSAGGGRVGAGLLAAAAEARALSRHRRLRWRLVTGEAADPALAARLEATGGPGLTVDRHHASLAPFLARAAVSVSQAGYNTVVETLQARTPMVLVPFAGGSEDEQTVRAAALERHGRAVMLEESGLTARGLALAIDRAATMDVPALAIDADGARRSAELIAALLEADR